MIDPLPKIDASPPRRKSMPVVPSPPPSIVHLMLFVACCALFLGAVRKFIPVDPTPIGLAIAGAYGLCIAGGWFLLCVFAARSVRRTRWPIEPGLWLGAALGVRWALEILLALTPRPWFHATEVVLDAVTCLCLVVPLFGSDVPSRWKTIVVLLIALYGLPLLLMGIELPFSLLRYGRPTLVIALLIAAALADKYSGHRGTWLHNLGVCVWIAYALFTIVLRLL